MKRTLCLLLILLTLPLGARRLRVAFVGDPQVDNDTELGYARRSVYRELRERSDIDLAIFLGDLVNDDVALLAPSRASLRNAFTTVRVYSPCDTRNGAVSSLPRRLP